MEVAYRLRRPPNNRISREGLPALCFLKLYKLYDFVSFTRQNFLILLNIFMLTRMAALRLQVLLMVVFSSYFRLARLPLMALAGFGFSCRPWQLSSQMMPAC